MADPLHSLTLGDVARENRRRYPGRTAMVCGETRCSFSDLDQRSTNVAHWLRTEGVGQGDRVMWLGQNCHRVVELLLACSKLGAIFCPANWRSSASELSFLIEDAKPTVIIAQHLEVGPVIDEVLAKFANSYRWVFHDDEGSQGYEALISSSGDALDEEVAIDDSSALLMIYSGAFEGYPNGSLSSSASLIGQGMISALVEDLSYDDVFLASGPFFHVGCWRYVLAMLLFGGTTVIVRRVEAEELCRLIDAERCTHAYLFAATQSQMVEINQNHKYDLSSMHKVTGDDQWRSMVSVQANGWLEHPQRYGQTEAGGIVAYGAFGPPPIGGHGRTNPLAQLRIVDDNGQELGVGEIGEIIVRGPMTMTGYHDRDELNAKKLAGDWVHTRDVGRREADGSITFIGPKTRMLKCGLENVYPTEVEQAVRKHPAVSDCAVIGVPHEKFIQVVKVVVVPSSGMAVTSEEIITHSRSLLANYKVPKEVVMVSELPRTSAGVDYEALDEQFGGGNYPGGHTPTGR